MKKIKNILVLVAAAAMGFTACQKEVQEDVIPNDSSVVISFVAPSADTKTSVDASGDVPSFAWNDEETFAVLEQTDALAKATSVAYEKKEGKAIITAEFDANADKGEYKYVTVYPEGGYVSAENISAATLCLPAVQTMAEGSYDSNADLMVSEVVTTSSQPTEAQMLRFTRLAAVVKMSFKGLELEAGDQVEQVIFTAEGKALAGNVVADLAAPHEFSAGETVSSVTVATESAGDVYFTVLPATLEAGQAYTVTVVTEKKLYLKSGTIPESKSLVFEAGMVTRFGVDMKDVVPSDKWVLVRDASTLKSGDVVAIAAKNYNYVVGKQSNNYPLASQIEVIKFDDYLYHPVATSETTADNRIQHYTLLKRDAERVAFDFYNGKDYEGDPSVGFVFATGSNYSPKLQSWCDNNTLFDVVIADGAATLKASEIEKSNKWWRYSHSTTASSRKFDCTSSEPTDNNQICLYKLAGAVGTIPTIDAVITVPGSDESVVIAEEGAATPEAISTEQVTFNYIGDWTISASAGAEWLDVAYDAEKNCLTYTAEANTDAKRETTVTITASMEGEESLNWSFKLIQKGAPQEITIAEFVKLSKDENTTYKLTGIVTGTATTSGTWKLSDGNGNVAQIKYLKTEENGNPYLSASENVKVEVGDVMTVTAVVTASTGASACGSSAYPSIYKGHYGLKASAGIAAGYTGGTVNIEVTTKSNGNIALPESVTAVMAENDFAELSYNGGDQATVTFASENTSSEAREAEVTFTYGLTSVVVTVQQGVNPANKQGYELVTDASKLTVGDEVIIVALNADKAIACPTSTSATSFPAAAISKTGNVIYDVEEAGVQVFTLSAGVSEGTMAFDFTYKDTGYRLYYNSGLKMRTTSYAVNAATSWTIDINAADGDATITSTRLIKFNSTGGTTFTAYATTNANATKAENAVAIYKKQIK